MSAESDSHPMDQEQPETHYCKFLTSSDIYLANSHPPESEDNPLPKTNRLKRLGRKKEQPQSEDEREPLELKESQEEEISILDILILTAALYTDEPVSKPKKKKKNLDSTPKRLSLISRIGRKKKSRAGKRKRG